MNLIRIIILLSLTGVTAKAQGFSYNYLGKDYLLYKGVLFKLDDTTFGLNRTYYSEIEDCSMPEKEVLYPLASNRFKTTVDSLRNRIFKVEDIVDKLGISITDGYYSHPIFILVDTITRQRIYYKYDKNYGLNFSFQTSAIKVNEAYVKSKIEREVDEFTSEIRINSPTVLNNKIAAAILYKYIKDGKSKYRLSLHAFGLTPVVNGKGAIILFTNGRKLVKQTHIEVEVDRNGSGYEYNAYMDITQTELQLLATQKIDKIRLYIFDRDLEDRDAEEFIANVKYLIKTQ